MNSYNMIYLTINTIINEVFSEGYEINTCDVIILNTNDSSNLWGYVRQQLKTIQIRLIDE